MIRKVGKGMDTSFIFSLAQLSDDELIKEAATRGIALTHKEIRFLRTQLSKATVDWLVFGIPQQVLHDLNAVLGTKKVNQLLNILK